MSSGRNCEVCNGHLALVMTHSPQECIVILLERLKEAEERLARYDAQRGSR